jgi:hypothetical protein
MRKTILGLVAAFAVIAAGSAPALACDSCSPCGYVSPCGGYVQPYAAYERLPDPVVQYHSAPIAQPQYYYVEQGPTYTGPGNFAPRRYYQEQGVAGWGYRHHYRHRWHHYGYHYRPHVLHSLY